MRNNKDVDDLRSWKEPTEFALPLAVIRHIMVFNSFLDCHCACS